LGWCSYSGWDALAATGYVSNWSQVFHHESYFESIGRPSLLRHLWSLAVEEQFYLLWPVLFAFLFGRLRRRYALAAIMALAVASAGLMAVQYEPGVDPSRIYYGTDTRAAGLLVGAALAFAWAPGRLPPAVAAATYRTADTYGFLALGGLAGFAAIITESDRLLYQGGFAAVALLTALVIAAAVHPDGRALQWVLGQRPLVWIGLRSYSIYLWHWPVFMLTRPHEDVQLDVIPLLGVRLALTLALAELSYRFVETPVRRGALGREWARLREVFPRPGRRPAMRYAAATFAAVALVLPLGASVIGAEQPAAPPYLAVERVQTGIWAPASGPERDVPRREARPSPTPAPTPEPTQDPVPPQSVSVLTSAAPAPIPPPPTYVHISAGRVTAIGDSVMLGTVNALTVAIDGISVDAAVSRQVSAGISILQAWRDAGVLGDVVNVHLGTNGHFSSGQFDQMMQVLADVRLVVFVNAKVPRDWEGNNNSVLAGGVSRYANTALVDWHSAATGRPDLFWDDGIHVRPEGARLYANLIASVLAAHPAPTPEPTPEPTPSPTPPPVATPTAAPTSTPDPTATPAPKQTSTPTPTGSLPTPTPFP
jgi:peptidoglycan/LPS O-acetylase OafA/YrhL